MRLNVTNDPKTEYYIIVEDDDKIQNQWLEAIEKIPCAEAVITSSVNEALCAWSRLFIKDCVPRCVIVDWELKWKGVKGEVNGIVREGAHYFLHYCLDVSTHGSFIVYTNEYEQATKYLQNDPVVGPHVTVIRKDKHSVAEALELITSSEAFTRQSSGFFSVPPKE